MRLHIPDRLKTWLIQTAKQTPYGKIDDYMERYWLVPYSWDDPETGCGPVSVRRRPIARLLQKLGLAIRIHRIKRSDDDRAYHDHPWWFVTIVLFGGYYEIKPCYDKYGRYTIVEVNFYGPGSILFRRATDFHRLILPAGKTACTLFITGRRRQKWGFMEDPKTKEKIYSRDYLKQRGL